MTYSKKSGLRTLAVSMALVSGTALADGHIASDPAKSTLTF